MTREEFLKGLPLSNTIKREYDDSFLESELFKKISNGHFTKDAFIKKMQSLDYAKYLFDFGIKRTPDLLNDLIENKTILLTEIDEKIPNAHYHKFNNEYLITFNSGLRDFIYRFVRAYSTRYISDNEKELVSYDDTCQKLADILWWVKETNGVVYGPNYSISETQMLIANQLSIEAELFFLYHEIGHVIIDLIKKKKLTLDVFNNDELENLNEEYLADLIGLYLLLGFGKEDPILQHKIDIVYAGAEMGILIFSFLEELNIIELDNEHPPSIERLKNLRKFLKRNVSDDIYTLITKISDGNNKILNNVVETIVNPNNAQNQYFSKKAEIIKNEFKEGLNRNSKEMVPDYHSFMAEFAPIFEMGYHHILANEIELIKQEHLQKVDLITFNKLKLVISLVNSMPEPAKTYFMNILKIK